MLNKNTTIERNSAAEQIVSVRNASEAEAPIPVHKSYKKVQVVAKNEYELNDTNKADTVYEKLERSTFFKNEQFRGFIYQQLRMGVKSSEDYDE